MKTIWKEELTRYVHEFIAPLEAEFIHVDHQYDIVSVWFICDPDKPRVKYRVVTTGTGHQVPEGKYIGTLQFSGGGLIYHYFVTEIREI